MADQRLHELQKNPPTPIYLHAMQIFFIKPLHFKKRHVRMHSIARQRAPTNRTTGPKVKTANQQQMMAAERKAPGLSLLARSSLASLRASAINVHPHQAYPVRFCQPEFPHARNIRGSNP
jgi:hypothetical protein